MTNLELNSILARLATAEVSDPDLSDVRDDIVEILDGIIERLTEAEVTVSDDDTPEGRLRRSAEKAALLSK